MGVWSHGSNRCIANRENEMKTLDGFRLRKFGFSVMIASSFCCGVFAMTPFTADSQALSAILDDKSGIWKVLHGRILSIERIPNPREGQTAKTKETDTSQFKIRTEDPSDRTEGQSKICTLMVEVRIKRDFTAIVGTPEIRYGAPVCR